MAELADTLLLSRSGLMRAVERLEQRGLVRREGPPSEPSDSHAVLTESGRAALLEARKTHLSGVRRHFLERFPSRSGASRATSSIEFWTG